MLRFHQFWSVFMAGLFAGFGIATRAFTADSPSYRGTWVPFEWACVAGVVLSLGFALAVRWIGRRLRWCEEL